MDKVDHLRDKQFSSVPFARETWVKRTTLGENDFKAYHLRGKHG